MPSYLTRDDSGVGAMKGEVVVEFMVVVVVVVVVVVAVVVAALVSRMFWRCVSSGLWHEVFGKVRCAASMTRFGLTLFLLIGFSGAA